MWANIKKLDKIFDPSEQLHRYEQVVELENLFKNTFRKHGIRTEKGNITIFHSSKWLLYTLIYNIQDNQNLSLFLGNLGSFQDPYIDYYKYMLKKGLKTKIIYDGTSYEANKRIENIIKLKTEYPGKVEAKNYLVSDRTSRKFIYDNMAIDGKKLLFEGSDLSYMSTIYLQNDFIERLYKNFEEEWDSAIDIKLESIPV